MDNKTILTKEEFDSLEYIKHQLKTAMIHNYATGITKDDIDLCADIVDKYLGKQRRNYNCTRCKLKILSNCASLYFTTERVFKQGDTFILKEDKTASESKEIGKEEVLEQQTEDAVAGLRLIKEDKTENKEIKTPKKGRGKGKKK